MDKTDEKALREIGEGMEALLSGIVPGFDPVDRAELLAAMVKGNYCKKLWEAAHPEGQRQEAAILLRRVQPRILEEQSEA
ncbi:MAG: hypothetical protein IJ058_11060 [Lachnospiraceae bacterium]|nr:hypothetical protein [Lachnospiraceae bacterium]